MKKLISISAIFFLSFVFLLNCSEQKRTDDHSAADGSESHEMHESHENQESHEAVESSLVRTGKIDLAAIDENEDGKLYECPMDWNVISDDKGECPVCGMHLKEYSTADVTANLDKYGFEHK